MLGIKKVSLFCFPFDSICIGIGCFLFCFDSPSHMRILCGVIKAVRRRVNSRVLVTLAASILAAS